MIQEFSVQNFLSFKEKQTISFLATADKKLVDELTCEPKPGGPKLLKLIMIYGANASGKSNLLQAIQSLWAMLFTSRDREHEPVKAYAPFELTKDLPIHFEIIFWANNRKYYYELKYDRYNIIYEKMVYSSDKDVQSLMYERSNSTDIRFGTTIGIKAKQRDDLIKETLKNHTILSTLSKKNIDAPLVIKELYEWIKSNAHDLDVHNDGLEIAEQAEKDPSLKRIILNLMQKADFNISDFNIVEGDLPKGLINLIEKYDILSESTKEKWLQNKQILFTHSTENEKFKISFGLQSSGTKVYFRLARLLFDLKKGGCIFMEDELDNELHYDLLLHYLKTYLELSCQSQLIFATHNQLLLDEDWMIRRDMVWFVEKDRKTASSILYRASEMGIHKNASLMNAYRIGKLGAKPVLGSTLLNIEK